MVNKANLLTNAGTIYLATDWDGITFADGTGSNESTIRASLDALTYSNVGSFTDFSIFHSRENERVLESDQCGVGEFYRSSELTPRAEFTWQEINNIDILAGFMGLEVQSVAGVLVSGATQTKSSGSVTYNTAFRIDNKNGNGTKVTINSITGSTDGALVANTDFFVGLDSEGFTTITIIDSTTVTTLAQVFTIDYDYTPASQKLASYKTQSRTVPYSLIKFVTCPNDAGEVDTHYLVKVAPTSEIQQQFVNLARTDYAGTSIVLSGAKGGNYLFAKETLTVI